MSELGVTKHSYLFCQFINPEHGHEGDRCDCFDAPSQRRTAIAKKRLARLRTDRKPDPAPKPTLQESAVASDPAVTHVLFPGRVIMIKLKWPNDNQISILNIYALVKKCEQPEFWATVQTTRREKHLPRPDFLLGDFNITEDTLDRAPPKFDNRQATDTLQEIQLSWEIQDQW
jgi:hypothetical protein